MTLNDIRRTLDKEHVEVWRGGRIPSAFIRKHPGYKDFLTAFVCRFNHVFDTEAEVLCWLARPIRICKCKVCGKRVKYSSMKNGRNPSFCSKTCARSTEGIRITHELSVASLFKEHGVVNNFQLNKEAIAAKAKATRFANAKKAVITGLTDAGIELLDVLDSFYDEEGRRKRFNMRCKECGTVFQREFRRCIDFNTLCPKCNRKHLSWSAGERQLSEFVESLGIMIEKNTRRVVKGFEFDVYAPEYNVAVEYDGLYWHCESNGKDKDYHLTKTINAADAGVRLIHVFEDEWIKHRSIVESRLRAIFGMPEERYHARKCKVVELDSSVANKFIGEHHLQGICNASVRLGLEYEGKLVAVMTFGKPRFRREFDWELLRYCSSGVVLGGAGKLLAAFRRKHEGSIISYADKRWSDGNLYRTLGFYRLPDTAPTPSYFKKNTIDRLHHIHFHKHKLSAILPEYDPAASTSENISKSGFHKIWDCGSMVFVLM